MPLLLGLLAPPACAACRSPVPERAGLLCADCLGRLPWLRGHRCPRCALPRHRAGCPASGAAFDRAWAPLAYEATARELVAALKFRAALPVAGLMAAQMAANLPADLRGPPSTAAGDHFDDLQGPPSTAAGNHFEDLKGPPPVAGHDMVDLHGPPSTAAGNHFEDLQGPLPVAGHDMVDLQGPPPVAGTIRPAGPLPALVPVPAHAGRRRRRGFDPAALLAAALADRSGLALAPCLRRSDRGRRQVGAGRVLRRSAGRFAADATAAPPPTAVLVDDVHTTGATLDACARALKDAGARWVGVITYVRTL